jgi:Cation efflux family
MPIARLTDSVTIRTMTATTPEEEVSLLVSKTNKSSCNSTVDTHNAGSYGSSLEGINKATTSKKLGQHLAEGSQTQKHGDHPQNCADDGSLSTMPNNNPMSSSDYHQQEFTCCDYTFQIPSARRLALVLSLYLNIAITLAKLIAYLNTFSLSVLAALLDSVLDVVSQVVLNYTEQHSSMQRSSAFYPAGASRLEPIGVLT